MPYGWDDFKDDIGDFKQEYNVQRNILGKGRASSFGGTVSTGISRKLGAKGISLRKPNSVNVSDDYKNYRVYTQENEPIEGDPSIMFNLAPRGSLNNALDGPKSKVVKAPIDITEGDWRPFGNTNEGLRVSDYSETPLQDTLFWAREISDDGVTDNRDNFNLLSKESLVVDANNDVHMSMGTADQVRERFPLEDGRKGVYYLDSYNVFGTPKRPYVPKQNPYNFPDAFTADAIYDNNTTFMPDEVDNNDSTLNMALSDATLRDPYHMKGRETDHYAEYSSTINNILRDKFGSEYYQSPDNQFGMLMLRKSIKREIDTRVSRTPEGKAYSAISSLMEDNLSNIQEDYNSAYERYQKTYNTLYERGDAKAIEELNDQFRSIKEGSHKRVVNNYKTFDKYRKDYSKVAKEITKSFLDNGEYEEYIDKYKDYRVPEPPF